MNSTYEFKYNTVAYFPKSSYLSTKKKKINKSSCQVDHIPANILLSAPHFLLWFPMPQVYNKKSNFKIKIKIEMRERERERKKEQSQRYLI